MNDHGGNRENTDGGHAAPSGDAPIGRPAPDPHDDTAHGPSILALELTGGMPCVRCTYDLRGLSVRGVCPECGTPIRATILARVDPLAKELQPLYTPKLTAGCLLLWTIGALAAAIAAWVPRIFEVLNRLDYDVRPPHWPHAAVLTGAALSGIGALALIRPHARIPAWQSWSAAAAAALYLPLMIAIARLYHLDGRNSMPYLGLGGLDAARATWRLAADGLILAILLLLRFNARVLTARSFVLRTGRIDRQTMLAMAAAVGVCAIGDMLAITAGSLGSVADNLFDALRIGSMLFVGVGSLLVTLGLAGMVMDAIRLVPVVAEAPLALSDVTRPVPAVPGPTAREGPNP